MILNRFFIYYCIEKVCAEFSHKELYSLFNDLERIQSQLDNLSGQGWYI